MLGKPLVCSTSVTFAVSSRGVTESPAPEASRACLDRRETKGPEASLDLPVPSASRLVPGPRVHVGLACGEAEASWRVQPLLALPGC